MKNPHPLSDTWNRSMNKDPVLVSVPDTNKKFKRKSREPKRLFSGVEPERIKTYPADMSDVDSVDDTQTEACDVGRLAPLQRQLMMSQEGTARTMGTLSGLPEANMAPAQSGAIDMRIGINVPAITSKLSQFPEISHWPTAISQPLSNRLKLGIRSTFPLSTSASSSSHSHSPSHQAFSLEPPLSDQAAALPLPRTSQTSQCHEHVEPEVQSPKDSPRKRVGVSSDGPGRLPEVKAIQQTRRLLANARERTRVHTISAAFEALRKQVPCYSYGQKLSKLAILRIACNYILSLAQLAELDYSSDHSSLSFSQCVEQCTRTLQAEGRSKKRKE
ncbi:protein atonal homolog 8 [Seriola lalandi dorsalis]|uniref:Protein atonal homolog 8 n=1 Tax=Seriola lalandi dorsalis TaxID=1841481 RepID=A0A3B4WWA9_SERLL|nr:protein atonal homolog 8 [Seriola lalandi dorsalis]XP_056238618.1 transcription factor atoh8 [Seriola aureovittata]